MFRLIVADLVADDGGQLIHVGGDGEHALVDADLVAGQGEGVGFLAREHDRFPVRRVLADGGQDIGADLPQGALVGRVLGNRHLGPDLLPALHAKLLDLLRRNQTQAKAGLPRPDAGDQRRPAETDQRHHEAAPAQIAGAGFGRFGIRMVSGAVAHTHIDAYPLVFPDFRSGCHNGTPRASIPHSGLIPSPHRSGSTRNARRRRNI